MHPDFGYFFYRYVFFFLFPFLHTTLCTLSCLATCVSGTIWSTFSPLQTWSCDTIVSVAERSQTYSPSTVLTLFRKKKKNSYGCNICIPDLWFEGKNLQCFFPCFLIGGMTKQDWNPNYASPAWQRVSPSGPSRAQGGGFTPVVSLLHDEHTSLSSCILPPASSSKFGKLKQNHHIPYPVRRNPMSWQLWPHGVLLDY